jgi:hypothetical protein
MTETDITRSILKTLRSMGIYCFKHWGGPLSRKCVSDIHGALPGGRSLAIEVKINTGRLTTDQTCLLEDINRTGRLALLARSVGDGLSELQGAG